jgi:hypothetical protein
VEDEDEDVFVVLMGGVSIDGVVVALLNAGSIRSSLTTTGDGAVCCCFLSSIADMSSFVDQ